MGEGENYEKMNCPSCNQQMQIAKKTMNHTQYHCDICDVSQTAWKQETEGHRVAVLIKQMRKKWKKNEQFAS